MTEKLWQGLKVGSVPIYWYVFFSACEPEVVLLKLRTLSSTGGLLMSLRTCLIVTQ
jgi:hypothetical protein